MSPSGFSAWMLFFLPLMSTEVKRNWLTAATSGSRRNWSASAGENGCWLKLPPVTMKSAFRLSPNRSLIEDLIDVPKTLNALTRASPIISAAAVEDVRRGLRRAFSWLIRPTVPPSAANGAPITLSTGRLINGLSTATPMKTRAAPAPTTASALLPARVEAEDDQRHSADQGGTAAEAAPAQAAGGAELDVPHRRHRRHLARATSGEVRRHQGGDDADDVSHDHGSRFEHDAARGQFDAERAEQALEQDGDGEPEPQPQRRSDQADGQRLDADRTPDLPLRCADGAQQGQFTCALPDQHAEGVADDEGTDEQRDVAEGLEEGAETTQALGQVVRVLLDDLLAGQRLEPGGQHGSDPVPQLGLGHAGGRRDRDVAELIRGEHEALRGGRGEGHQRRAGEVVRGHRSVNVPDQAHVADARSGSTRRAPGRGGASCCRTCRGRRRCPGPRPARSRCRSSVVRAAATRCRPRRSAGRSHC